MKCKRLYGGDATEATQRVRVTKDSKLSINRCAIAHHSLDIVDTTLCDSIGSIYIRFSFPFGRRSRRAIQYDLVALAHLVVHIIVIHTRHVIRYIE